MEHEKLLNNLISIDSLSGNETEIRNYIQNFFKERGIDAFLQEDNLIVHFEGKDNSRAFILNSHMDTVSRGDKEWKYGPLNPTKVENKLFGLGSSDMKSGMTASMLLAEQISNGIPLIDMWFTYVVKEEHDGSGTSKFAHWFKKEGYLKKYKDIAGIFTEPTGLVEIEHGHRGNMFIKATSKGGSGHGSRPNKIKKHAVREMIKFADVLQEEFSKWSEEFSGTKFQSPTVGEMTSIQAGLAVKTEGEINKIEVDSPNKFPSLCVATFDVRTTPDFHKVAFKRLKEIGKKNGIKIDFAFPPAPSGYTDPNERIVKITKSVAPGLKLTVSKGSADLGFLTTHGIKAIIFGPGVKDQCHKLNEYTYPAQIPLAVEMYKQIFEAWAT